MVELMLYCILGAIAHIILKLQEEHALPSFNWANFFQQHGFTAITNLILSVITVIVLERTGDLANSLNAFIIGYSYNSALNNILRGRNNRKNNK